VRNLSCLGVWCHGQDSVWELPRNKFEALLHEPACSELHVVTCQKTVIDEMLHDELFNLFIYTGDSISVQHTFYWLFIK
jgi:hypothetical protein